MNSEVLADNTDEQDDLLRYAFSYQQGLIAYAYSITRNWSLSQDAFQEAMIALHHQLETLEQGNILAWLKRVVHHKAVDIVRKSEVQNTAKMHLIQQVAKHVELSLDQDVLVRRELENEALQGCMKLLSVRGRELLLNFYYHKKSCVELEQQYQRSANALRLKISRTRGWLKQCISKKLNEREGGHGGLI